ncbi:GNAT family N-acetyltransferase [Lelliottia sp. V89_10]|uniref:GNAT family N-acetyltransferase n=1 Tax=Lelliottia wanjuensis TaxID=3050585 RepID=UPI00249F945E|nr:MULTISPECIES: GNAT family N-acetyltransferase [unclassified Lelliottia]MDI3362844.1 GNAT family N-acetyltransferase [Lelliottia sp. V89_13]MDK9547599.1 GNAT family N-acetyltransferase [Lelliottia sp. V89_5]MDK9598105.1 GNAT family N-acetyltransferase [Lelliottia sp. V89_10]
MTASLRIHSLSRDDILLHLDSLAEILENCVNGGASVSFMLPFTREKSRQFWQGVAESVGREERTVLACRDESREFLGTVQLITDQPENQPHRGDVAKLLVHEKARRRGVAMALMEALEAVAVGQGKNVLVLDTATGSGAETFYQRAGWQKVGEIPRYALMPDGEMTATSVFYKFL